MSTGSIDGFGSITWWGFSPAVDLTASFNGLGETKGAGLQHVYLSLTPAAIEQ